jgi:uncharacterized protein YciI
MILLRKEISMSQRPVYYALTLEQGEGWDDRLPRRQQKQWDGHATFMDALADEGFVILGGPLGDGKRVLLIFAAESEQEIAARLANDPWTPLKMLRTASVERWEILLDGRKYRG